MDEEAPDISELLEAIYRMERTLGIVVAYLEHPDVDAMPFACRASVAAARARAEMDKASVLRRRSGEGFA